jgi:hypothetical protein
MFQNFTEGVAGIIEELGLTFVLAGFVPMLIGVAVNQYMYFAPPYTASTLNLFPAVVQPWLGLLTGPMLTTILLAFVLGAAIILLNPFIIKLFEGLLPGVRTLLAPLLAAKRRRYEKHGYAAIQEKRSARRALLTGYEMTGEFDEEADFALQQELQKLHAAQEKIEPIQQMPYDPARLAPTSFGNAWAAMEEYPVARYGMDGMFFWPYVRAVLLKKNPELLGQIDNQKMLTDMIVHMGFVAGVLALEGAVVAAIYGTPPLLGVAGLALVFFWLFYRAAVQYVRTMGTLIKQGFDLYRLDLLDAFQIARPAELDEEYWVWMRLNAFLRRGEPFYYEMLDLKDDQPAP